ncbi:MAG: hypothetical protein WAM85_07105 [Terracidiphilus sp.]
MKGTVLYGPRDARFEEREAPRIEQPTDAIIRVAVTCVYGSDLWPYGGIQKIARQHRPAQRPRGEAFRQSRCSVRDHIGEATCSPDRRQWASPQIEISWRY